MKQILSKLVGLLSNSPSEPRPIGITSRIVVRDVFISYNSADEEWAKTLAERIERETIDGRPESARLSAFFSPWDIEYGPNFINRLNDGLRDARFFAPVLSPEFFDSGWANFEWTDQVALDPTNATGRVIPLFLREVLIDGKRRIEFPAPFTTLNRIDFVEPTISRLNSAN